jgi:hypothetical protein
LLDDELLSDLGAAGSSDVVVVLPTRNHAPSVQSAVGAVLWAFAEPFVRERTLLLCLDAGSSDETLAILRSFQHGKGGFGANGYVLRSIHQIVASFSPLATRGELLQVAFTASELTRARGLVVLDPAARELDGPSVERWIGSVLALDNDYVKPRFPRSELDGPLVTQILSPLLGAIYGAVLHEPADTQLACSAKFVAAVASSPIWSSEFRGLGGDVLLSALALRGGFRLRELSGLGRGPLRTTSVSFSDVFRDLVGAALWSVARDPAGLRREGDVREIASEGPPLGDAVGEGHFDVEQLRASLRLGVDALEPLWRAVLEEPLLRALTRAAVGSEPLDDELWAGIVFAVVGAAARRVAPTARLAQMLESIYLGRVAALATRRASTGHLERPDTALLAAFRARARALASELGAGKEQSAWETKSF